MPGPSQRREAACDELGARRFDLLVIGGGIVGAGIAAHAARLGLTTALVDRGDFGSGTSSASSKLIHGGLRYLRLGDIRLVREAHRERSLLMHVVAPHLVYRVPFLLPLYRSGPHRPGAVQAGLVLYAALARARLSRLVAPERARTRVPGLRLAGLRSCGLYADAATNDGRLCLANVRAAAEAGATVVNYAEVRELRTVRGHVAGAEVSTDGRVVSVSARSVVNATGPWVDAVRRLEDPSARPSVRLSKGAHVLLQLGQPWTAALTIPHDKVRVSFAVPWQGMLLLGTTDTLYEGEPGAVEATEADVEQILAEAAVALEVLHALQGELALHALDGRPFPLPGAGDLEQTARGLARRHPELEPRVCSHLAQSYGTLAEEVLGGAEGDPDLLRPLHPEGPDLVAQAAYAVEREWACTAEDVLRRRTAVALRGLATDEVLVSVNALLAERARSAQAAL